MRWSNFNDGPNGEFTTKTVEAFILKTSDFWTFRKQGKHFLSLILCLASRKYDIVKTWTKWSKNAKKKQLSENGHWLPGRKESVLALSNSNKLQSGLCRIFLPIKSKTMFLLFLYPYSNKHIETLCKSEWLLNELNY